MTVVRERALLARTLLLEIAVAAACDAGALDLTAVRERRDALRAEHPDGLDAEQLLDTSAGMSAQLEAIVSRAQEHRARAAEMRARARDSRARAMAMRERNEAARAKGRQLADAHEALALLSLLDEDLFEIPNGQEPDIGDRTDF